MVTSFAFMHLRSSVGMAKHVRRVAYHLIDVIKKIGLDKEAEKIAESKGSIEGVEKTWGKLLDAYKEEESEIADITEAELKEVADAEKLLEGLEDEAEKLEKALEKLKVEDEALHKEVMDFIAEAKKAADTLTKYEHIVRKEERDQYRWHEHILKYANYYTDEKLAKVILRLTRGELGDVEKVVDKEKDIDKTLNDLHEAIKKNNIEDIKKNIDKLKADKDIFNDVIAEAKDIAEIIHDINVIHMRLMQAITETDPQEFQKLAQQGFPNTILKGLSDDNKGIASLMHNNMRRVYRMARYEEKRM